jgi:hypothetical protein
MCCGRKTPRKIGKRSKLIKKPLPNENDLVVVPEMPEQPRQELNNIKSEEQSQV